MTVIDLGTNIVQYTQVAAQTVGPQGRVHAFEPTPSLAAHVCRNLELNRLENATVHAVAVSDAPGQVTLNLVEANEPNMNSIVTSTPAEGAILVPTVTLDDFAAKHSIETDDVVKMDLEAAALQALRGATNLLAGTDSPVLVLELNPKTLALSGHRAEDLLELLTDYGYAFHPIAAYCLHTDVPFLNGIAAKAVHVDLFPALARWKQQPLSGWNPAVLTTLTHIPLR